MPFTSGSRCAAMKLYSLTVVMPELSVASALVWSCAISSLVIVAVSEPGPILPMRHKPSATRPTTTRKTAT